MAAEHVVSPIDVLLHLGWLTPDVPKRWQQGRLDCLESAIQASHLSKALALLQTWAEAKGLQASLTDYVARTPQRQPLRFSLSGDPHREQAWRTHWLSPALPERQRERLAEKASKPPELVVIQPLNHDWKCHRCGGTGGLLMMEPEGPACLRCAGLGDLDFLPSGDALLTRRAKARSARVAVVVRFSSSRKRYERQGLLVEPQARLEAEREVDEQRRA
jgi:hypothetical protein